MKQVSNFIGTTAVDNLEMVGRFYKIVRSNSSCYEKDITLQSEITSLSERKLPSWNYFSIDTCNISFSANMQESIYRPSVCLSLLKRDLSSSSGMNPAAEKNRHQVVHQHLPLLSVRHKSLWENQRCVVPTINCNVVRARTTLHYKQYLHPVQILFLFCFSNATALSAAEPILAIGVMTCSGPVSAVYVHERRSHK